MESRPGEQHSNALAIFYRETARRHGRGVQVGEDPNRRCWRGKPQIHPFAKENLMVHAIRFAETGGPEVLIWQQVSVDKPGPGQVRLRHTAIGFNFIDAYIAAGATLVAIVGSKRSAEYRRSQHVVRAVKRRFPKNYQLLRIQRRETGGRACRKLSLPVPHQHRITDNHDRRT
jgi:hypothetical protein